MQNFDIDELDFILTHLTTTSDAIAHCKANLKVPGKRAYRENSLYLDALEKVNAAQEAIGKLEGHFLALETEARKDLPPKEEEDDEDFEDDDAEDFDFLDDDDDDF